MTEETTEVIPETKVAETPGVPETAVCLPLGADENGVLKYVGDEKAKPVETKIVPIELHNINLLVELKVPLNLAEKFTQTRDLVQRLRDKFGNDSLIEELTELVHGTVEKVTISRPDAPVRTRAEPTQVSIPQTQAPQIDPGLHLIQSTHCPWTGVMVRNLDPGSIYSVLYTFPQKRALLSPQDVTMMEAYYRNWYEAHLAKVAKNGEEAKQDRDDLPY